MTGTQAQGRAYAEQRKRIAAQVKEILVRRLDLDRGADEIPDDCPLFGIGLCLDSIDALEIGVAVEDELGVRIEYGEMKKMQSVNAIVDLILARRDGRPVTAKRVHQRTRTRAGLADLEAWTRTEVIGPDADVAIDAVVGCNVRDLFEGRAAQTLIPSPTGGVEAIVWVMALKSSYRIVAEPAERAAVELALKESTAQRDAEFRDIGEEQFALALIGPEAGRVARSALGDEVESVGLLNVRLLGRPPVLAARLVHFGEHELHLFGEASGKEALVEKLERAAGEDLPRIGNDALAGMMAESGSLSRVRDIPHDASVFEAGLEWMVELRKLDLRAAEALERAKGAAKRKCVMMTIDGDAAGLRDQPVLLAGQEIGRIQSAYDSGTLGCTVAVTYLTESLAVPGLDCTVGAHGRTGRTVSAPVWINSSVPDMPC